MTAAHETPLRRLLLVGHGRMGRLVETLAPEYGFEIAGIITGSNAQDSAQWPAAAVAIDFSVGDAVPDNIGRLLSRGTPCVIGTTGWQAHEDRVRDAVATSRSAVVVAPNFALGVNVFLAVAERAGALLANHREFGAWIHEQHHQAKRDAPSGTALALKGVVERAGYTAGIDMASTRAGSIPGTHTLGFDSQSETITLTHAARDRAAFARGALEAARWVQGRHGWFTMREVVGV